MIYRLAAEKDILKLLFVWPSEKSISFYERQGFLSINEIMELEM